MSMGGGKRGLWGANKNLKIPKYEQTNFSLHVVGGNGTLTLLLTQNNE
jgi:hypothetical protein